MRRSVILSVAGSLTAAVVLAGCGSSGGGSASVTATPPGSASASATPTSSTNVASGLAPKAALAAINKAVQAATSVHYSGVVVDGKDTITLDVTAQTKGDADATVTMSGDKVQIRLVGSNVYLSADKAFWTAQTSAAVAAIVGGRWIKFPKSSSDVSEFVSFTDVNAFLDIDDVKTLKNGPAGTINGVAVFTLIDTSKKDGGVLSAASAGEPLPVRLTGTVGSSKGSRIDFTQWNAPVSVVAPPASDVLDISQLAG